MSSRGWDLPIYVTNVDADGVVGQEGSIRKGTPGRLLLLCLLVTVLHFTDKVADEHLRHEAYSS